MEDIKKFSGKRHTGLRLMCKSKIQRPTVTEKNINYAGSIKIDEALLEKADILPYEVVLIVNVSTGARFETYTIPGKRNSGIIGLQGGTARLGEIGDKLIIISSTYIETETALTHKPKLVFVNEKNKAVSR
ncbi:MAG: aspartate 1-decarboxylase [Elusimicrobia bacterium RIFOXYA2_FULL_39_19]|nr:MAG: aspartate 1-decarboxylase [Elusimicrobia bacterium RIFOXYA2_FULL_39_19]